MKNYIIKRVMHCLELFSALLSLREFSLSFLNLLPQSLLGCGERHLCLSGLVYTQSPVLHGRGRHALSIEYHLPQHTTNGSILVHMKMKKTKNNRNK